MARICPQKPVERIDSPWLSTPTQGTVFALYEAFAGAILFSFKTRYLPAFFGRSSAFLPDVGCQIS